MDSKKLLMAVTLIISGTFSFYGLMTLTPYGVDSEKMMWLLTGAALSVSVLILLFNVVLWTSPYDEDVEVGSVTSGRRTGQRRSVDPKHEQLATAIREIGGILSITLNPNQPQKVTAAIGKRLPAYDALLQALDQREQEFKQRQSAAEDKNARDHAELKAQQEKLRQQQQELADEKARLKQEAATQQEESVRLSKLKDKLEAERAELKAEQQRLEEINRGLDKRLQGLELEQAVIHDNEQRLAEREAAVEEREETVAQREQALEEAEERLQELCELEKKLCAREAALTENQETHRKKMNRLRSGFSHLRHRMYAICLREQAFDVKLPPTVEALITILCLPLNRLLPNLSETDRKQRLFLPGLVALRWTQLVRDEKHAELLEELNFFWNNRKQYRSIEDLFFAVIAQLAWNQLFLKTLTSRQERLSSNLDVTSSQINAACDQPQAANRLAQLQAEKKKLEAEFGVLSELLAICNIDWPEQERPDIVDMIRARVTTSDE